MLKTLLQHFSNEWPSLPSYNDLPAYDQEKIERLARKVAVGIEKDMRRSGPERYPGESGVDGRFWLGTCFANDQERELATALVHARYPQYRIVRFRPSGIDMVGGATSAMVEYELRAASRAVPNSVGEAALAVVLGALLVALCARAKGAPTRS
jgi:hypothetical protein